MIRTLVLAAVAILSFTNSSFAAPAPVKIELLVVRLREALALRLVPELQSASAKAKSVREIEGMLLRDEAKLVAWLHASEYEGNRISAETHEEVPYFWEYIPPMVPQTFGQIVTPLCKSERDMLSTVPGAIDRITSGVSMEATAKLTSGLIELTVSARHTVFLGFDNFRPRHLVPTHPDFPSTYDQPRVSVHHVQTSFSATPGDWHLLSTFKVTQPSNALELFFLRASHPIHVQTEDRLPTGSGVETPERKLR